MGWFISFFVCVGGLVAVNNTIIPRQKEKKKKKKKKKTKKKVNVKYQWPAKLAC